MGRKLFVKAPPPSLQVELDGVTNEEQLLARFPSLRRKVAGFSWLPLAIAISVILAVWYLATYLLNVPVYILPLPHVILLKIIESYQLILSHLWVTLFESVIGLFAAIVLGVLIACLIVWSAKLNQALLPILAFSQTVPKVAIAPLFIFWFGFGIFPKIVMAFLISFFPIVVATVVGLKGLDRGYANLVKSMGASEAQVFLKVRLPAALPSMFGSFKVALSLAVIGAVLGEYVAAERGLGYLQLQANANFDVTLNFAAVFVIALLGVTLYSIIIVAEKIVNARQGGRL